MIVDQDEIEALLAQAEDLVEDAGTDESAAAATATVATPPPPPRPRPIINASPEIARILRIKVPVIVQLASRRMDIAAVRKFSLGMIIEFHKGIDDPLNLLINNHPVGKGDAVKVGEHFGLRVSEIRDAVTRIKSLGE